MLVIKLFIAYRFINLTPKNPRAVSDERVSKDTKNAMKEKNIT
jgi:hypothetical protein